VCCDLALFYIASVDTIRCCVVYLTCSKKLTVSQHSLPHGVKKKCKRKTNKNLAIANRSRVSCAHAEGIYRLKYYTVTLKCRLRVTQCHWKRNHWIDHTRLSSSRVMTLNTIVTLKCGLEVTEGHWKWYNLKALVRFPIRLP